MSFSCPSGEILGSLLTFKDVSSGGGNRSSFINSLAGMVIHAKIHMEPENDGVRTGSPTQWCLYVKFHPSFRWSTLPISLGDQNSWRCMVILSDLPEIMVHCLGHTVISGLHFNPTEKGRERTHFENEEADKLVEVFDKGDEPSIPHFLQLL